MRKFNNDYHFQLTGDFTTEQGLTVSNPVCKIITKPESAVNTGKVFNMIQGFKDKEAMNNGKSAFVFEVSGNRTPDFEIPVVDSSFYMFALGLSDNPQGENAFTTQAKFIANLFNIDVANVVYAKDVVEA